VPGRVRPDPRLRTQLEVLKAAVREGYLQSAGKAGEQMLAIRDPAGTEFLLSMSEVGIFLLGFRIGTRTPAPPKLHPNPNRRPGT
jgi:hypothetical protein